MKPRHHCNTTMPKSRERTGLDQPSAASTGRSFLRHGEIYRSDVASGRRQTARPASRHDDRRDEFPPVIPWQVALQQSPPPLHRLVSILQHPSPVRKLTGTSNPPKKGDVLNVVSTIARKCLT